MLDRSDKAKAIRHDKKRFRAPGRAEVTIGRLDDCRSIVTRYDKHAVAFLGTVELAALFMS